VAGGFYLHRELDLNGEDRSSAAFLVARGITGLPGTVFAKFGSETKTYELAGFGELTYHLTDKLTATGGIRYGKYGGTVDTYAGFNTAYFTYALFGISGPLALDRPMGVDRQVPVGRKGVVEGQPDLQAVARPDDLRHGLHRLSHAGLQRPRRQRQHRQSQRLGHPGGRGFGQPDQLRGRA
jgi:outer membrane receptor protein involved in Fe transport